MAVICEADEDHSHRGEGRQENSAAACDKLRQLEKQMKVTGR